jgi:hypothetical protein
MKTGLIVSFVMAAFGSGFNWYAQRRGVLVTGAESGAGDLAKLPAVLGGFLLALPRMMFRSEQRDRS